MVCDVLMDTTSRRSDLVRAMVYVTLPMVGAVMLLARRDHTEFTVSTVMLTVAAIALGSAAFYVTTRRLRAGSR